MCGLKYGVRSLYTLKAGLKYGQKRLNALIAITTRIL